MSPLQIATNGANKWTVPSALPTQSKSPPQLTAWALSAQRAANTMYRARSLLQKIGRDLIWMKRCDVLNDAKRSGQPGVRPTITNDLLAAYLEPTEEPAALPSD